MIYKPSFLSPSNKTVSLQYKTMRHTKADTALDWVHTITFQANIIADGTFEAAAPVSPDPEYPELAMATDSDIVPSMWCFTQDDVMYRMRFTGDSQWAPYVTRAGIEYELIWDNNWCAIEKLEYIAGKAEWQALKDVSPSDIFRSNSDIGWKFRLYEAGSLTNKDGYAPSTKVGYGTVSKVQGISYQVTDEWDSGYENGTFYNVFHNGGDNKGYCLTVFPHTNIYDQNCMFGKTYISDTGREGRYKGVEGSKQFISNITRSTDDRCKYYIRINGRDIPIKAYLYYDPRRIESEIDLKHLMPAITDNFDSYCNPVSGYVLIDKPDDMTTENFDGKPYTIMCNYIDSDESFFDIAADPIPQLSDALGNNLSSYSAPEKMYALKYSEFELTGGFKQKNGILMNNHYITIDLFNQDTGVYENIGISGTYYSAGISYKHGDFLNNRYYRLTVHATDNNNRTFEYPIYLYTDFSVTVKADTVTAEYNPANHSIVVDFCGIQTPSNVKRYKVYKQFDSFGKWHKVADIADVNAKVIEDFCVGDDCPYTYCVCVVTEQSINGHKVQTVSAAYITKPLTLDTGKDIILTLSPTDRENVFTVDTSKVWTIQYNMTDDGYTNNTAHTYNNSLNRYGQQVIGEVNYKTKSVEGLLAQIDCSDGGTLTDRYTYLTEWNKYTASSELKVLVDTRGLLYIGNFDNNTSVVYKNELGNLASVRFDWLELMDLDMIEIHAAMHYTNPLNSVQLADRRNTYLASSENMLLYSPVEEG